MRRVVRLWLVLSIGAMVAASSGAALAGAGAVRGPRLFAGSPLLRIAVSGNHFADGVGRNVTLHGVNISGTEFSCRNSYGGVFAGPSDDASIAAIAAWHVNAVRIPLNEDCWLGINGLPVLYGSSVYRGAIRAYVNRLHAHGLYAILALSRSGPGATKSLGGQVMADADHSPAFWQSVASAFKADRAVLFDLYNEPQTPISWRVWRDGGFATGWQGKPGFQTAGMQQLVNAVRSTGATQPVIAGGIGWAKQDGQAWLDNRPFDPAGQLAAAVHVYDQADLDSFNSNIGIVADQFPEVATEIGEYDCGHAKLDVFMPWADSRGVSYLAWAWYVGKGGCAAPWLLNSYNGTPNAYGQGYRDHLLSTFLAPGADAKSTPRQSLTHPPGRIGRISGTQSRGDQLQEILAAPLRVLSAALVHWLTGTPCRQLMPTLCRNGT